jgi:hypothetical protein
MGSWIMLSIGQWSNLSCVSVPYSTCVPYVYFSTFAYYYLLDIEISFFCPKVSTCSSFQYIVWLGDTLIASSAAA